MTAATASQASRTKTRRETSNRRCRPSSGFDRTGGGRLARNPTGKESPLLLAVGIVLLVIAIAGGAIIHPILFALGIVALILFFQR